MPIKFTSREKRDELAERLMALSQYMQSSFDQGHDGRIGVSDDIIGDLKTAACVIALSDVEESPIDRLMAEQEAGLERQKRATGTNQ